MAETAECAVIGAGVIGLAVARGLAIAGREVVVLEAADAIGTETSSRNSEVIHAGIYYPTGSFKARACVDGKHALYRYCEDHGVPHQRLMKLVVATRDEQRPGLEALREQATRNGVRDLEPLDGRAVNRLEPAVRAVAGLLSPSTGIVDSHRLMLAYLGDAESHGAMVAFLSPVTAGRVTGAGVRLEVGGAEPMAIECRTVVNCAGFLAQSICRGLDGVPVASIPAQHFAKGSYYSLRGRSPFRHLVYPMPEASVLGVHVTLDLGGQCRFGPDLEWVDEIDYDVDTSRESEFYRAIRTYYPDLGDGALQPAYAGIRPKIHGPGEPQPDFLIQGADVHGVPGLINLYGIESPGLTSSLVIAEEVVRRVN